MTKEKALEVISSQMLREALRQLLHTNPIRLSSEELKTITEALRVSEEVLEESIIHEDDLK